MKSFNAVDETEVIRPGIKGTSTWSTMGSNRHLGGYNIGPSFDNDGDRVLVYNNYRKPSNSLRDHNATTQLRTVLCEFTRDILDYLWGYREAGLDGVGTCFLGNKMAAK